MLAIPVRLPRACLVVFLVSLCSSLSLGSERTGPTPVEREISVIVPFSAGGSADRVARLFASKLSDRGVRAVVRNIDGASGVIAYRQLLASSPRVEVLVGPATPLLSGLLSDADVRALTTSGNIVCQLHDNHLVLVQRALQGDSAQLSDVLTRSPRVSSGGIRSIPFLALHGAMMEGLGNFTHVPYRGEQPALVALSQGEVELAAVTYSSFRLLQVGLKLEVIALLAPSRAAAFPHLRVLGELGFPVRFAGSPGLVVAQTGASPQTMELLSKECYAFDHDQGNQTILLELGYERAYLAGPEATIKVLSYLKALLPVLSGIKDIR